MTHHHHRLTTIKDAPACSDEQVEEIAELPPARIFDADFIGQAVPEHFNAVRIPINGTMQADLAWDDAKAGAEAYCRQGLRLLWEIDLGLFDRLQRPLGDQAQFQSLVLALEHFRDTLWKRFQEHTAGLCLYRGSAEFSAGYLWDEQQLANMQAWLQDAFGTPSALAEEAGIALAGFEAVTVELLSSTPQGRDLLALFCRDAAAEYLELLARRLPDLIQCAVLLDGTGVDDPLLLAQLTINERYPSLSVAVKQAHTSDWQFAWDGTGHELAMIGRQAACMPQDEAVSIGVCLPQVACRRPSDYCGLREVLADLHRRQKPFRVVAESRLTTEWDGLDYLIVAPQSLSAQGHRKLRGFCAAGGTVVSLGGPVGVAQELPLQNIL